MPKKSFAKNAVKEDGVYKDRKYVKMAGHTAYVGVLEALDVVFGNKRKGRKSVDWYKEELANIDRKVLTNFLVAYDVLHLSMSYDGNLSAAVSKEGIEVAEKIIEWAEQKTAA